jgi:hypothetical protein
MHGNNNGRGSLTTVFVTEIGRKGTSIKKERGRRKKSIKRKDGIHK